ncbi:MAG: DUF262 domain-containing protein [Armatimonadetes bacterium]|nr:DUF262 domain-containing protein [Armatimonadota bacterium]
MKRSATTKDIGLLRQLHQEGQIRLAPEFQRNAVWPRSAKAYLIDTILVERPMPLFFFQRGRSAQTGRSIYSVVDGQQRLRAIFEFLDDRFSLTESEDERFQNKRFSELGETLQNAILNYNLTVEELTGYGENDIEDIFVRMNKYVVKLSPQEIRHARAEGRFFECVEELAKLPYWSEQHIFTKGQLTRMRSAEFSAELVILLIEGPQDKKASVDLYYRQYQTRFPQEAEVKQRLRSYLVWIATALPELRTSRLRKPTHLYSLIGALDSLTLGGKLPRTLSPQTAGRALGMFEKELSSKKPSRRAINYLAAAGRQTDNIGPRTIRIETFTAILADL